MANNEFLNDDIRITKTTNYKRPKKTIQDLLQDDKSVHEHLKNSVRIDNIDHIDINSHIRYVTYKNGKQLFRLGGFLKIIKPEYIVLSNRKVSWSVQKSHYDKNNQIIFETVFFKKENKEDQYIATIKKQEIIIQKLTNKYTLLNKKFMKILNEYKKLKK